MVKLQLLILSVSLFALSSSLTLPSISFFGGQSKPAEDSGKSEGVKEHEHEHEHEHGHEHEHEHEHDSHPYSTLNLPGLPGIPLPPLPPMPAFLSRPVIKATKTVVIEMTHYEKTHPVCWTVDPHKPACNTHDSLGNYYEDHEIKPTVADYSYVKPTHHFLNAFSALQDKFKPKPHKPSAFYKPIVEPESEEESTESEKKPEASSHEHHDKHDKHDKYEHHEQHDKHDQYEHPEQHEQHEHYEHHETEPLVVSSDSRQGRYIQFGTPVVASSEDIEIDDAPKDALDEKDSRIIHRLLGRQHTHYETKTIYTTTTKKYEDMVTATLIIDNCVPVDASIPKCKSEKETEESNALVDNYGHSYEHHFDEEDKAELNFLQKLKAQQSAYLEGGAHYAAQVAAQHAAYHASLAHKFHSAAAHFAQNNANNALAAEHAALENAHHHHVAEHAAHENLAHILNKHKKNKDETPTESRLEPALEDSWRIETEGTEY